MQNFSYLINGKLAISRKRRQIWPKIRLITNKESGILAFKLYENHRPWMTLKVSSYCNRNCIGCSTSFLAIAGLLWLFLRFLRPFAFVAHCVWRSLRSFRICLCASLHRLRENCARWLRCVWPKRCQKRLLNPHASPRFQHGFSGVHLFSAQHAWFLTHRPRLFVEWKWN